MGRRRGKYQVMPPGRERASILATYLPFFMSWVWRGGRVKAGMVLVCLYGLWFLCLGGERECVRWLKDSLPLLPILCVF